MTLLLQQGRHAEHYHIFRDQLDQIKIKRTAVIRLANFPSEISLGTICEVLSDILSLFSPPVHLERLILSDNALKTLPNEFELLCGIYMRYLDLHNNNFTAVPAIIGTCCPHLEGLDLSLNHLSSLPWSVFCNLLDLKVLLIKNNEFNYLPPLLGEMINLDAIGVADNPLLMPTLEMVKAMQGGTNDLKAYLLSNSATLEQHIQLQTHNQKAPTTPSVARTRSFSESGSKSLKASRRMGLIINSNKTTPEDATRSQSIHGNAQDMITPSKPERKLLLPNGEKGEISILLERKDSTFNLDISSAPSTYTTSTASISRSTSPSGMNSAASLSRPTSRNRSRSNTLKDINAMLESSELTDSEHKSGAYFRRLSTLQERPADEAYRNSQEELAILSQSEQPLRRSQPVSSTLEISPIKSASRKPSLNIQNPNDSSFTQSHQLEVNSGPDLAMALKVARKLLFSFSEVHSSFKRFTGFCSDRKVVLKVVPVLHTTKGNIDLLVESIEAAEDSGDNYEPLMNALHSCIKSFKQIFEVITDNLASFVARIDICFVRMVYLTLYGSFNEMQNAYRLLNPFGFPMKVPSAIVRNQSGLTLTSMDPKFKQVQSAVTSEEFLAAAIDSNNIMVETDHISMEEIDEKLYQCIDLATTNAQIVFSELTKAIGKSAIASANTNGSQSINLTVSTKFKELTNVCMTSMDITKRLKIKLSSIRSNQTPLVRRLFWDDINLFLKAILQTFSSVKGIMRDAPILNEVRQSMALLTKTTKDLTILLEASSYKSMSENAVSATHLQASLVSAILPPSAPPSLNSVHSTSTVNLSQLPGAALVRTPLVATVGAAAAQAILPPADNAHFNSSTNNAPVSFSIPPLVSSDVLNTGLHTAPVQSMEQYYAKNVNPFDRI
ncbi:CIC11C00000000486 [Sungouiella intermedia]|uniref:CIC11C00000000486 n=1 Tax=Sungouiella intermedia TaxID=45354 RepID=A0A1L0DZT4_9ASCO|nr:CIC11C00000000486 [[Candida] intermedia]